MVTRFTQERRVLAGVRDPHVVSVLDLVAEGDTLAIVMDYVDGPNLHDWLTNNRTITAAMVARLGGDIARGLAALHAADVVHCDLKPANILIATTDGELQPEITDFGISTVLTEASDTTTAVMGTPRYMAPEVLRHEPPSPATDVYALGMVLYEMAAGVSAFSGSAQQVARAQLDLLPGKLDDVPRPLWDIIESALEKDPAARPSADRITAALERILPALDAQTPLPRYTSPPVPQLASTSTTMGVSDQITAVTASGGSPLDSKPRRGPLIAAGAIILAGLAGAAAFALRPDESQQQTSATVPADVIASMTPTPSMPSSPAPSEASPSATPTPTPATIPLTSLSPKGSYGDVQHGVKATIANDPQEYPNSIVGNPIQVNGIPLTFKLERRYSTFAAVVGIAASSPPVVGCYLVIEGDDKELYPGLKDNNFTYDNSPYQLDPVSVEGVYYLTIDVDCGYSTIRGDDVGPFVIGNPTLTRAPTSITP